MKKALIPFIGNFIFFSVICMASILLSGHPHPTWPSVEKIIVLLLILFILSYILPTVCLTTFLKIAATSIPRFQTAEKEHQIIFLPKW